MELVGAALENHIYGRSTLHSIFRGRKLLHREFLDRIVAEKCGWNPQESWLADRLAAVKAVVVRHAVNQIVVRGGALAADAHVQEPAARRALYAGGKGQDGFKVTALRR